jgi:hypothetical protein
MIKIPETNRIIKIQKSVFVFLILSSFFMTSPAHAWADAVIAAGVKQTMENIARQIEGALLGNLKIAAIQLLNNQVLQAIDGSTGKGSVITNFDQFLNTIPEEEAERVIVNDFLSQVLRGKESNANYIGANQSNGAGGSYNAYLKKVVLDATVDRKEVPTNNFAECSTGNSDPRLAIAEGDFRALSCLFENEANNPIGISLAAESTYNKTLEEKKKEQEIIAQSPGVKPILDTNGNVVTTAGTVQNLIDDVTTLGGKMIVGATNPGEFLSGVVVSVVNRTVSKVIRQGTGEIQRTISREVGNINSQTNKAIYNAEGILGPAAGVIDSRLNQTTTSSGGTPTVPVPKGP